MNNYYKGKIENRLYVIEAQNGYRTHFWEISIGETYDEVVDKRVYYGSAYNRENNDKIKWAAFENCSTIDSVYHSIINRINNLPTYK